jgi:hypothetical protein
MARFFGRLSSTMTGGPDQAAVGDMLTVLAALAHAGEPLTVERLATALGWHRDRVSGALRDAEEHPEISDPITLRTLESGAYSVDAGPYRLTAEQREALGGRSPMAGVDGA